MYKMNRLLFIYPFKLCCVSPPTLLTMGISMIQDMVTDPDDNPPHPCLVSQHTCYTFTF